ncbi:SRPBCC family protein [Noviherbaspirillum galbum]|uniref:Uncharacterized protein n=1 Tax=Noviherbaspirillum galbum TaxID=2709383 RepID=A0A6B3SQE5_9BURK|nr:hypothetical protein [Noviherbaspirillum galbum]NEX60956.1 hypothetical protein [Noviherbaspirillum galbum]
MLVEKSTLLPCGIEQCIQQIMSTQLLKYVSWPLVRFVPMDPPALPVLWESQKYLVKLRLFGFLPFGKQTINISVASTDPNRVVLRDNAYGSLIDRWDHRITLVPIEGGTLYTDRVHIRAGILTPVVWAFAWFFYRHRQRRWRKLVDSGFTYSDYRMS